MLSLSQALLVLEVQNFQKVQREVPSTEKVPEKFRQIRCLADIVVLERFEVVPQGVLERVFVALWVVPTESLRKQSVELVEKLLLIDAAVNEHLDNLSFLLLLEAEASHIFEGLNIVFGAHDSLKDSLFNISVHVLFSGKLQYLRLGLA